ncbi:MAG: helix-turn-helix domain-containing protein [Treponema sp.]|nr:helix-turn-helix domain-containing protein [Treponema sp.]
MTGSKNLTKYLIPVFYTAAMMLMVFYAWNEQIVTRKSGSGPFYRNLMDGPAWIRRGFDPAELNSIPVNWVLFESRPLRIVDAPFPDIPKRRFLSPFGNTAEEFTIIFPVEMDSNAMAYLRANPAVLPGLYFAAIGENWEIYLNGTLVRSHMHLDDESQIIERRRWRHVYFPMDSSLIVPGTNILALRIIGDPAHLYTGLAHKPHYLDDYHFIENRHRNILYLVLCAFFGLTCIVYLMIFLTNRKKSELFNLYFSIFSMMLFIFTIANHSIINALIPNSDITFRLRNCSLSLSIPIFGMFFESLVRGKLTRVTKGYLIFTVATQSTTVFFAPAYNDDFGIIWYGFLFIYFSFLVFYNIIYFYFWDKNRPPFDTPIVNICIGALIIYICGIYEILDALFFYNSYMLFIYSTCAVQIGMTFTLYNRFRGMYRQLETTVAERNQLLARIETSLSQTAVVPKSLAKGSLSFDIIAGRAFINSDRENRDLLLKQKEFAVLLLLMQNEGETMSAETIYENVWKQSIRDDKNTLKVTISNIRKKIEPSGYTITASRREGYVFEQI